jgi:hypothetical protein
VAVKDNLSVAVAARGMQMCLDSVSLTRYLYSHEIHFASNSERMYVLVTVTHVQWRVRTHLRAVRSNNATVFVVAVLIPIFQNP